MTEQPDLKEMEDDFREPCPVCEDGDKVPAKADYWRCPKCDAEWFPAETDTDE